MRGWGQLGAYNFIHALRFATPPDAARWQAAALEALRPLRLDAAADNFEIAPEPIAEKLETEINQPFAPDAAPLRFFLCRDDAGAGHWLGLTIDHWLADDFSARLLLERIVARYEGRDLPPLRSGRPSFSGALLADLAAMLQQARALRRAARIPMRNPLDLQAGVLRRQLPLEALEPIRARARAAGATVNDLLLASIAQACGASRRWPPHPRRRALALATAMDTRRFEPPARRDRFGFFISQYTVALDRPETIPLLDLTRAVAKQTRPLKATPGRALFFAASLFARTARSTAQRITLVPRGAPLAAGLSNINLTGTWMEDSPVREFRRIGPTGPVVPLVFMVTTLRGVLSFDVTYRSAAFTGPEAEALADDAIRRLTTI